MFYFINYANFVVVNDFIVVKNKLVCIIVSKRKICSFPGLLFYNRESISLLKRKICFWRCFFFSLIENNLFFLWEYVEIFVKLYYLIPNFNVIFVSSNVNEEIKVYILFLNNTWKIKNLPWTKSVEWCNITLNYGLHLAPYENVCIFFCVFYILNIYKVRILWYENVS